MKTFYQLFCFSLLITLFACGGDDDNIGPGDCSDDFNYQLEITDELQVVNDAALAYANDPSTENCNDYVAALNLYLDAAELLEDCVILAGQQQEYNQAIDDARDEVNAIQC